MFGIGETELVIIVVFAFLLFGPDKLPGMGRTLGRVLRQFREASDGFNEVVQTNIMDPASEELEKSPKQRKREEAARLGEDADVESTDDGSEAPAPKRETFAERKARLKAEREAAELAAAAEAFEDDADEETFSSVDAYLDDDLPQEDHPAPSRPAAADLYSLSSRKSSRTQAKEDAQKAASPEEDTASARVATVGEEDGSEQA